MDDKNKELLVYAFRALADGGQTVITASSPILLALCLVKLDEPELGIIIIGSWFVAVGATIAATLLEEPKR